jgi:NAD(P)-dependent dehydrogenase (short-subunit alcohol dehydrogenase family)
MIQLQNKVIVVTGGNGLLGKQMIKHINEANGIAINIDIGDTNNITESYICDITNSENIQQTINKILKKHKRIDGWVNNAYPRTKDWGLKYEDIPEDSWKKSIDDHLNGYNKCCKAILEIMKQQKNGSLINMASIYGVVGPDFHLYENCTFTMPAAYAAIKGGVINLTRYLASYYGLYNIRVNCISPGGIWDHQPDEFVKKYNTKIPLKRMGKAEDIAPSVVFLLSDSASYITGHNLIVDGGWTAI